MTNDQHHYDRCPHIDYIKDIIIRKMGFCNIVEGTYISLKSTNLRQKEMYNKY